MCSIFDLKKVEETWLNWHDPVGMTRPSTYKGQFGFLTPIEGVVMKIRPL